MLQTIHLDDTVSISKQSVWCDLLAEVVVLHVESGVYFGFERVGYATWHFLQEPRTAGEVVTHLMSRYDVPKEVCENQTLSFLQDLATHSLIVVEKHAAS